MSSSTLSHFTNKGSASNTVDPSFAITISEDNEREGDDDDADRGSDVIIQRNNPLR